MSGDGFARVHHVGSDEPEVVKCQCPGPEDTDTDPPLSWDAGWAPTPAEP